MSWLDADWRRRAALCLPGTGSPVDVTFTPPPEWDAFWTVVDAAGDDLRFTTDDGRTLLTYKLTAWNSTTRAATIELDAVASISGPTFIWMYWGNSAATAGATTPTITTPVTATVFIGEPRGPIIRVARERTGGTTPRRVIPKGSGEGLWIWWDFGGLLQPAASPIAGVRHWEEIQGVTLIEVRDDTDTDQPSMYDEDETLVTGAVVGTWLTGGTAGDDYIAACRVRTSLGRIIDARAKVRVNNMGV